jgi:(p)ppGpp synthase/HD superfamily hydrolase
VRRSKIRHWFKRQAREHNISQGKAILERELQRLGLKEFNLEQLSRQHEYKLGG